MTLPRTLLLGLLAGVVSAPAWAQEAPPPPQPEATGAEAQPAADQPDDAALDEEALDEEALAEDDEAVELEEVVVTAAGRQRGAVIGDIPPEIQLDARDIRAIGAGNLTELLEALAPQISSGRGREAGRPVILLNGRRISGFSEIRGIPPEAIQRMDILPEEVALKYGYRADQRVVNIVLRRRFRATTAEAGAAFATAGGREQTEVELNHLRIRRENRWIFDLEHRHAEPLLESEREVEQAVGGRFDLLGNIVGLGANGEIDPALSALAGRPITVAGVPALPAGGAPGLDDFAETAGLANVTDLRPYRTLLGRNDALSLNATVSRPILGDVSATFNARLDVSAGESLIGLPSATFALPAANPFSPFGTDVLLLRYSDALGPLTRESDSLTGHLGLAMNGEVSDWRWSLTANYDRTRSLVRTDTGLDAAAIQPRLDAGDPALNPFGPLPEALVLLRQRDRSQSNSQIASAELVVNGDLAELPAGDLSATVRTQLEARSIERETLRAGFAERADLSRERGSVQVNLDLPVASRRREVLPRLGNLSFNGNLEVDQLSDFGALTTLGYGLNWSPVEPLTIIASVTEEDGAPSVQQLGEPVLFTPQSPVFDYVRGETVEVTRIDGGNPALQADSRTVMKLGLNLRPFEERDLSFSVNYNRSRIENPISAFPGVTAEIEAAFPERFTRDAEGRLVSFDSRPVNFARSDREEVRWGVNYSKPLRRPGENPGRRGRLGPAAAAGPAAAQPTLADPGQAAQDQAAPAQGAAAAVRRRRDRTADGGGAGRRPGGPGFGGPGGGRGGFGGRGFGGGQGRLQFALYHTLRLEDSTLIRDGLPELDFLDGAAVGSRGGRSRHEVELQAGVFRSGLGARLEANWLSGTTVRGGSGRTSAAGDLAFSDLTTVNLRLFADLGQQRSLVQRYGWLRGSRVTVAVNNLFDGAPEVRDAAGLTPVTYEPDRLDPLGRSVRITFRKLFIGARPGGGGRRRSE